MTIEKIFKVQTGEIKNLKTVNEGDSKSECYFTPAYFAIKNNNEYLVSTVKLTLKQVVALLVKKGYNYDKNNISYSLNELEVIPFVKPVKEEIQTTEEANELTEEVIVTKSRKTRRGK